MNDRWRPHHTLFVHRTVEQLTPGTLIVLDRQPYRVIELNERPYDLWPEPYQQAWRERHGSDRATDDPTQWWQRPLVIVATPDTQPTARPRHVLRSAGSHIDVLPEHYLICHRCGELPPCREAEIDAKVTAAAKRAEQLMAIPAGHCLGCGQAITHRHEAFRYPGPNLWRPDLGENSAVFHAARSRRECRAAVADYDAQWAAAAPGRRRRFACEGNFTVHADGSYECTSGEDCPLLAAFNAGQRADVQHSLFVTHRLGVYTIPDCWCLSPTGRAEHAAQEAQPDDH